MGWFGWMFWLAVREAGDGSYNIQYPISNIYMYIRICISYHSTVAQQQKKKKTHPQL